MRRRQKTLRTVFLFAVLCCPFLAAAIYGQQTPGSTSPGVDLEKKKITTDKARAIIEKIKEIYTLKSVKKTKDSLRQSLLVNRQLIQMNEDFEKCCLLDFELMLDKQQKDDFAALINFSAYYGTAETENILGNRLEAIRLYEKSLQFCSSKGTINFKPSVFYSIAGIYRAIGSSNLAIYYYKLAVEAKKSISPDSTPNGTGKPAEEFITRLGLYKYLSEAQFTREIGDTYSQLGDRERAMEFFQEAEKLPSLTPSDKITIDRSIGLMKLFHDSTLREDEKAETRLNEEAERSLDEAVRGYERLESENKATAFDRTFGIYSRVFRAAARYRLGKKEEALKTLDEHLGFLAGKSGASAESLAEWKIYRDHLDFLSSRADVIYLADLFKNELFDAVGSAYRKIGEHQKAINCFEKKLDYAAITGNVYEEAFALENIGGAYSDMGDYEAARKSFYRSIQKYRLIDDSGESWIYARLMTLERKTGNTRLGIFFGKQSVDMFQKMRVNVQSLGKDTEHAFSRKIEKPYRELTEMLISENRKDEALQIFSFFKEDEFFNNLPPTDTVSKRAGISYTEREQASLNYANLLLSRITATEKSIEELKRRETLTEEEKHRLSQLETEAAQAVSEFDKFTAALPSEFGGAGGAKDATPAVPELEAVQKDLKALSAKPDVAAIYTLIGGQAVHLLMVTQDEVFAVQTPVESAIFEQKLTDFLSAVKDNEAEPRWLGGELYRILVQPLEEKLQAEKITTLMWSLDGKLRYIPVAALYDAKKQKYLVETYRNVLFTPAGKSDVSVSSGKKVPALGFGVSENKSGVSKDKINFVALKFAEEQLREVIRRSGEKYDSVYEGERFMNDGFTGDFFLEKLKKKQFPIVLVASHFYFNAESPPESFLLTGDGTLTLADMQKTPGLFENVEILGLSACETAIGGENDNGREIESFAVLAQQKGAKAILASLWRANDKSTSGLMRNFYQTYSQSLQMSKAEALRLAQFRMLKNSIPTAINGKNLPARRNLPFPFDAAKPYAHPYYWSPFILTGNWR